MWTLTSIGEAGEAAAITAASEWQQRLRRPPLSRPPSSARESRPFRPAAPPSWQAASRISSAGASGISRSLSGRGRHTSSSTHRISADLFALNRTVPMRKVMRVYSAEFVGTFWLVLGGCGSAVLSAAFPGVGIGLLGVSLAFGLTVLTMAFAIGHISGCHLNPAVTVGLVVGRRFKSSEAIPYIIAQVIRSEEH